jgi:hypothetical protein
MDNRIINRAEVINSLQVSVLRNIPAGYFNPGIGFLVKNITEENMQLQVRPAGQSEFITTVLYPGWNPEIYSEIKGVLANTLQYGY